MAALSHWLQADPDAEYAEVHEISLADVDSMVALYPSPDNGMADGHWSDEGQANSYAPSSHAISSIGSILA